MTPGGGELYGCRRNVEKNNWGLTFPGGGGGAKNWVTALQRGHIGFGYSCAFNEGLSSSSVGCFGVTIGKMR